MNPTNQPDPTLTTGAEPQVEDTPVPIWLIILMSLLVYGGAVYFDSHSGWFNAKVYLPYRTIKEVSDYQPRTDGPNIVQGKELFEMYCGICHLNDGTGKPGTSPPLAGSEWVNAEGANRLIRIPVLGLAGPIEVKGQKYNFAAPMTAVAADRQIFTDEKLANILSYMRQAWGNKAPPVTAAQVKEVRDELGSRSQQLSVDEALSIPEKK